ncbi:MAG: hypothetical protein HY906_24665 [Deltaproteobacteria bacterium]|nr:hypothetical protein [Deltaproteobacteria bacterium]
MRAPVWLTTCLVLLSGCGPTTTGGDLTDGGAADDASVDGVAPPTGARLHGQVWGPGHQFPVAGALVAAYRARPDDIPETIYCEECVELPPDVARTTSGPDGSFQLEVLPGQIYFLAVQKGQFRRVREYAAPTDVGDYSVEEQYTTLPSRKDQTAGDMIPNIALVFGDYDAIQDLLAKVGIGQDDGAYGLQWGSEAGVFDVYDNSMPGSGVEHHGEPLASLLGNPARMAGYHLILFACSYNANFDFMANATAQANVRDYVRGGGKLYVSDYAYPVVEMPWPEFIWFTDELHGGCVENRFPDGCNHGPPFEAPSRSLDGNLSAWLLAVDSSVSGTSPTATFRTKENWDTIGSVAAGFVGVDPVSGADVTQDPKVWVEGTWNYAAEDAPPEFDRSTYHPFTVSWPFGCGRVLYTTYHTVGTTTGARHPGFLTQELILWYLVMELQVCQHDVLL